MSAHQMRILVNADDVTDYMLIQAQECVEWFVGQPMPTEDFIDRFCKDYGGYEWDIERFDTPAVKKIMRFARSVKREAEM